MITSFRCKETEKLYHDQPSTRFHNIERIARRKLEILDAAEGLGDLRVPPGNRLESLKGNRSGWHGIRINDQWRICFRWEGGNATNVEIMDYH
jgi:proteic killer suppression protein